MSNDEKYILQSSTGGPAYKKKLNQGNTFLERNTSYNKLNLCYSSVLRLPIDWVLLTMLSQLHVYSVRK